MGTTRNLSSNNTQISSLTFSLFLVLDDFQSQLGKKKKMEQTGKEKDKKGRVEKTRERTNASKYQVKGKK